jgi:hypothetical protein
MRFLNNLFLFDIMFRIFYVMFRVKLINMFRVELFIMFWVINKLALLTLADKIFFNFFTYIIIIILAI